MAPVVVVAVFDRLLQQINMGHAKNLQQLFQIFVIHMKIIIQK